MDPRNANEVVNESDEHGRPAGGYVRSIGLDIRWQDGPCARPEDANGTLVENVLEAALSRIGFYQESEFSCYENHVALDHIHKALDVLNERTAKRVREGVEGKHVNHSSASVD